MKPKTSHFHYKIPNNLDKHSNKCYPVYRSIHINAKEVH